MRLFLARHGTTVWNELGLYQGRKDTELSPVGLSQARALGEALRPIPFDAIYSSPLRRALDTALLVAKGRGMEVSVDEDLSEIDHGEWEGKSREEVRALFPHELEDWLRAPHLVRMPGGESLEDVKRRVLSFMGRIYGSGFEQVLAVSHDAVIKVMLCTVCDAPLSSFWRFQVANGAFSVIELSSPTSGRLVLLNESCHLGAGFSFPEQRGL